MTAIIPTKDAHVSYSDAGLERRKAGFKTCLLDKVCRTVTDCMEEGPSRGGRNEGGSEVRGLGERLDNIVTSQD